MSHNHGVDSAPPSRRSVVKGAAWAVPAVVVAGAAPTVAASAGPLSFSGAACKLPGASSSIFKGYVFELVAVNQPGPGPTVGVTVISDVRINDNPVSGFQAFVFSSTNGSCTCPACTPAGAVGTCATFCTPDGASQRIFVYTNSQENSSNSSFSLRYQRFECSTCVALDATPVLISTPILSTPPITANGGGSCNTKEFVPIPAGNPVCSPAA